MWTLEISVQWKRYIGPFEMGMVYDISTATPVSSDPNYVLYFPSERPEFKNEKKIWECIFTQSIKNLPTLTCCYSNASKGIWSYWILFVENFLNAWGQGHGSTFTLCLTARIYIYITILTFMSVCPFRVQHWRWHHVPLPIFIMFRVLKAYLDPCWARHSRAMYTRF